MARSLAEQIALLPEKEREEALRDIDPEALLWSAEFWLRPEQQEPEGDWSVWLYMAGRGAGKALSDEEILPTPNGWVRMGDVRVGDVLFDQSGCPVSVVGVFPQGRVPCSRVTFSDGSTIDASDDHLWTVLSGKMIGAYARHVDVRQPDPDWWAWSRPASTLRRGRDGRQHLYTYGGPRKHVGPVTVETRDLRVGDAIPLALPIDVPPVTLPVDPYVFGYWLGDGTAGEGSICSGVQDVDHLRAQLISRGYGPLRERIDHRTGVIGLRSQRLHDELRSLQLAPNRTRKRVPEIYLRGSIEQRLDLLRGLMDSDGHISARCRDAGVGFIDSDLADVVYELAVSLGYQARRHARTLSATKHRPERLFYGVDIRPVPDRNPFLLPRKADRVSELPRNQATRKTMRRVVAIESIGDLPATCIAVDNKSHLFLAGRSFVPTHNTRAAAEWIRKRAKTNDRKLRFGLVARTASDVRDVIVEGDSGILSVSPPSERPEYQPSRRRLVWPNGHTALCFCVTPDTEALTRDRGWVTYDQLYPGDVILTLNTTTGLSEWQPLSAINVFNVVDEPIAEIGGRFHSSATTLTHRWPVWDREGRINWVTTGDIVSGRAGTKSRIIGAAPCADLPTEPKYSDALVEIAAWFMCEGTVSKTASHPSLSISQSPSVNPVHHANITRALTDLFGPPREKLPNTGRRATGLSWRHVDTAAFHLDPDAAAIVLDLFEDPRHLKVIRRDFILSLTRAQLELFVARCVDADGHRRNHRNFSMGQNHPLRDEMFALALTLLGFPYSQFHKRGTYGGEPYDFWTTSVRRSPGVPLVPRIRDAITVTPYTGVVWCPTTPNSTWFARRNGKTYFTGNSADEPDQLRGPQFDYAWADEAAAWRQIPDSANLTAWDNLRIATRLANGHKPQIIVTTTPKRVDIMRRLLKEADEKGTVVVTRGSTKDNIGNLDPAQVEQLYGLYGGNRMGLQELEGMMLDDVEGALWTQDLIDENRTGIATIGLPYKVVGVDPTVADRPGDECGIIVCASTADRELYRRQAWVIEDATVKGSPETWAQRVVDTARKWGAPVVAETNQGGALVANAIHQIDPGIPVYEVHSKQGKALRAEPISLAYEQGRVHHMGTLAELETQMTQWIPGEGKSPDRVDALVHALTALLIKSPKGLGGGPLRAKSPAKRRIPLGGPSSRGRSGRGARVFSPGR